MNLLKYQFSILLRVYTAVEFLGHHQLFKEVDSTVATTLYIPISNAQGSSVFTSLPFSILLIMAIYYISSYHI